jgi:hypothetical protein
MRASFAFAALTPNPSAPPDAKQGDFELIGGPFGLPRAHDLLNCARLKAAADL